MRGKNLFYAATIVAAFAQPAAATEILFTSEMLKDKAGGDKPFWYDFVEPIDDILPTGYAVVSDTSGLKPLPSAGDASFVTLRVPVSQEALPGVYLGIGVGEGGSIKDTGKDLGIKLSLGANLQVIEDSSAFVEAQSISGIGMVSDFGDMGKLGEVGSMGDTEFSVKVGFKIKLN